ncbi:MAG: hypothetical protein H6728_01835 [Myxococcales bacterium]|nr:hypothetical protein [Myxococcales bacterium]MCB9641792.1 hypothetical protein [Myxococcales bacterium]
MRNLCFLFFVLVCLGFTGSFFSCTPPNTAADGQQTADASPDIPADQDLQMTAEDFGCILTWDKVNHYRITNKLGYLSQTLEVARSANGGTFPVGTIIQLVPQEAMVKRRKGWNPTTNDWEFFFLNVSKQGTEIATRGKEEVKNAFGGQCFSCHNKAAPQWDLICGADHGCDPLPFDEKAIEALQKDDPRCP